MKRLHRLLFLQQVWTAPIQLIITMILLINQVSVGSSPSCLVCRSSSLQIGASALVGMSLFILITPLQTFFMKVSFPRCASYRRRRNERSADAERLSPPDFFQGSTEVDGERGMTTTKGFSSLYSHCSYQFGHRNGLMVDQSSFKSSCNPWQSSNSLPTRYRF